MKTITPEQKLTVVALFGVITIGDVIILLGLFCGH